MLALFKKMYQCIFVDVSNIPFLLDNFFSPINYLETVLTLKNVFLYEIYVDKNKPYDVNIFLLIIHFLWLSYS